MGKTVLLAPNEEMLYQAHNILQEKEYYIDEMAVVGVYDAPVTAKKYIDEGASIIIARGGQAQNIKENFDIPVVEIIMTAQEMGLLITRAKRILNKPHPVIAVSGTGNMFCDMSYFNEIYDIELRTYYADDSKAIHEAVHLAVEEGADLVIGGSITIEAAEEEGIPSLYASSTEESLRNAFALAKNLSFAMESERRTSAQLEILQDYSYNGIMYLDYEGMVTMINQRMLDLLRKKEEEVKGQLLWKVMPKLDESIAEQVLKDGKEYMARVELDECSVICSFTPVKYDDRIQSVVVTCQETDRVRRRKSNKEDKDASYIFPVSRFEDQLQKSALMRECIRIARLYALSEAPVTIIAEAGTERRTIARCIHNSSSRRNGPFLDIPCEKADDENQRRMLFGAKGAAMQAEGGTLLLSNPQVMTDANQYRLYQLIKFHMLQDPEMGSHHDVDVRIMVILEEPLINFVERGELRKDLYYVLSELQLEIPSLRDRPEDLSEKINQEFKKACKRYSRYHTLTEGARKVLMSYNWPGNLLQVDSFIDALVLKAQKRSIDELAVNTLFKDMYPETYPDNDFSEKMESGFINEEAKQIAELLEKNRGNREKTAKDLGISRSTLWRYIKKYGIS